MKRVLTVIEILIIVVLIVIWVPRRSDLDMSSYVETVGIEASEGTSEEAAESTQASAGISEETAEEPILIEKHEVMKEYKDLSSQNSDMVGFIYLPEGSYPVVQRVADQNYYLDKNFFGEEDKNGSIFANRYSNLGQAGISLLYGHTMRSGAMFGGLKRWLDKDYFSEHSIIRLDTLYECMNYEVVAVIETSMHEEFCYFDYVGGVSESDFNDWKAGMSGYVSQGSLDNLSYGDVICELSCCAYHVKDGRLVLVLRALG